MKALVDAFREELTGALGDRGVRLVLVVAVLVYAAFYPLPYQREVLKDVPVVVVDLDGSVLSRQLARMADAHEAVRVAGRAASAAEAEQLVREGQYGGALVIPRDFERTVKRGETATAGVLADASVFLIYRQVLTGLAEAAGTLSAGIEVRRLEAQGMSEERARAFRDPLPLVTRPLFNAAEGYASYVVPGVLVLLLQQTLFIGIGIRAGTARQRLAAQGPAPADGRPSPLQAATTVLGRTAAYLALYSLHASVLLVTATRLYSFPARGLGLATAAVALPFLLSSTLLALALSSLFRRRETAIQALLFSSLPALFLSGYAWPPEAMPAWLRGLSLVLPTSSAIPALLRIDQMGASLRHVAPELAVLWLLVAAGLLLAVAAERRPARGHGPG